MYTTGTNPNYRYSTKMGEDLVNDFEEVMAGKDAIRSQFNITFRQ